VRRLLPFIATAWVLNLLLIAGFSVWTGGFAWGPRYLTAPIVLLAPLFAAVLASGKGWFGLIGISFVVQFCSVVLPSSAENYVESMRNAASPGACTPWTCDCAALCLRLPWTVRAIVNTALARPLPTLDLDSSAIVDNARVLESSDYNSVYWWLVRAAYRVHVLSPMLAFACCLGCLAGAAYALRRVLPSLPETD